MNAIQTIALSKAIAAKAVTAAREELSPGSFHVDMTVRVRGIVDIAEDTEKTPTASIPVKEVLALFIARSGATREASVSLLRECLTIALSHGVSGEGAIQAAADIDEVWNDVVTEVTRSLPKTPVKGAVKAKVEVVTL